MLPQLGEESRLCAGRVPLRVRRQTVVRALQRSVLEDVQRPPRHAHVLNTQHVDHAEQSLAEKFDEDGNFRACVTELRVKSKTLI